MCPAFSFLCPKYALCSSTDQFKSLHPIFQRIVTIPFSLFFFFPFHAQHYQSFKPSLGRFTFQSPCSCSVGSCPAHLSTKCPEVTAICQMLFLHMATWEWLQDYWEAQGGGTDYTIIWVGSQVTVNLSTERESTLGKWKARGSRLGSRCGREHLCPSYLLASLSGSHRQHEINNCT